TMPVKIGLRNAAAAVVILGTASVIPLIFASFRLLNNQWYSLGYYLAFALVLLLVVWMIFLFRKATAQHYAVMSRMLKIIMLLGVGSLLIYYKMQYGQG